MKKLIVSIGTVSTLLIGGYIGCQYIVNNEIKNAFTELATQSQNKISSSVGLSSYNPFTEELNVSDILISMRGANSGVLSIGEVRMHLSRNDAWRYYTSEQNDVFINTGDYHFEADDISVKLSQALIDSSFPDSTPPPFFVNNIISGNIKASSTLDKKTNNYYSSTSFTINKLGTLSVDYAISAPNRIIDRFSNGINIKNESELASYINDLEMLTLLNMQISLRTDELENMLTYTHEKSMTSNNETLKEWLNKAEEVALSKKVLPQKKIKKIFDVTNDALSTKSDVVLNVSTSKPITSDNIGSTMMLSTARSGQDAWVILNNEFGLDMDIELSLDDEIKSN